MTAITTYDTLQDEVANASGRSAYASGGANATDTEGWITLVEARVNRILEDRNMHTRTTDSTSSEYNTLPTDFGGMIRMLVQTDPERRVEFIAQENYDRAYAGASTGYPRVYTIEGDSYRLGPAPDDTYTIEYVYRKRVPALSDANTSNWLLTDNPDLYLYGTLVEMGLHLEYPSTPAAQTLLAWQLRYDECVQTLKRMGRKEKYETSAPQSRPDFATP